MAASSSSNFDLQLEEEEFSYGAESGCVEARTWCDHLGCLSSDLAHIPAPDTPCNRCLNPGENWLCLCCKDVLCSRFVNKHMLQHYNQTNHCLALGYSDLSVWCYNCNAYLDSQAILQLRPVYKTAYILKFSGARPFRTVDHPDVEDNQTKGSRVEAQTWCDHLGCLSSDLAHIPAPDTPCNRCLHPGENWLCLCCKDVLCSRFVNKHMLQHYNQTNHCLALGYSDLSVWCYNCDAYLDAQAILQLRPVYETAYILKFGGTPAFRTVDHPDVEDNQTKGSRVEARTWCDHLGCLSSDLAHIPAPDTPCNRCLNPGENWICLCCKDVLCSRFVNKHMLQHYNQTNHCLALGYSDLSVWCYNCNAYLDAQAILQLRPVYKTAYILKFGGARLFRTVDHPDVEDNQTKGVSLGRLRVEARTWCDPLGCLSSELAHIPASDTPCNSWLHATSGGINAGTHHPGIMTDGVGGTHPDVIGKGVRRVEELEWRLDGHFASCDYRLTAIEESLEEIRESLRNLGVGGNRRPEEARDEYRGVARVHLADQWNPNHNWRPNMTDEDSIDEDDLQLVQQGSHRGKPRPGHGRGRGYGGGVGGGDGGYRENYYESEDFRLKVDLPTFDGSLDIEGFLDWLSEVDRFFDYMDTPEEKKVKLVAYRLKGGAALWWDKVQENRRREGKTPIRLWTHMRQKLWARFLPADYEQYLFSQYQKCVQGQRTVHEYTAEFLHLAARNDLHESEGQQVSRYLEGLRPALKEKIGIQVIRNVSEAQNLAHKAEITAREHRGKGIEFYRKSYNASSSKFEDDLAHPTPNQPAIDKPAVRNTSKKAMEEAEAYKVSNSNPYARPISGKCYKCNQLGHRLSDCPLCKKMALIEQGDDVNEVLCDPNEDGDYEEDEHGQTYVVRRTMLSPKVEENIQRCQLFRTRCEIQAKTFELIIDSGSQENIIGKEAVKQLQLEVEKHPSPYTIGWIKSGDEIKVTERCKVPFSIGKYRDEVYCDVVDMDACQILFGRP